MSADAPEDPAGGDEFAILLCDVANAKDVASRAQEVLAAIEQPVTVNGHEIFTCASIGICMGPDDAADAATVLKTADMAMYRAKHNSGNQFCFYTRDLNTAAVGRLKLEAEFRAALSAGAFELHYQPRVDLASGAVTSVEALIRRPALGFTAAYRSFAHLFAPKNVEGFCPLDSGAALARHMRSSLRQLSASRRSVLLDLCA